MKREDLLAMEPGEELDGIVSQEIFGVEMIAHVPYSSDISAAWEVVEKLEKEVTVKRFEGMTGYRYWCRISGSDETRFDEKIAHGTKAPEAICKASLLAVLEDINLPGEETTE